MDKTRKITSVLTIVATAILLIVTSACSKKESTPPPARQTTFNLMVKDVLGVNGTVTFIETSTNATIVNIILTGAPSGTHPAELHMNTAIEGGALVISLNPVDATGRSSTSVTTMTYTELIAYDGFIQVLKSSGEPNVILAQGDIGGNVITATNKTYVLDTVGTFGVSGTALFQKRVNGNTLVTITLIGTIPGDLYPATINLGSIASIGGGPVVKGLNNIDGTTGKGYTNIRKLNSGVDITYDNWLVYDGYINIYEGSVNPLNIICHGNIGSN